MRAWTLLFVSICVLTLLASGPDSRNLSTRVDAGTCATKDCSPTLPWYEFDPACCAFKQAPHHYYQRANRDKTPKGMVHCYERLKICDTWFTGHDEMVDEKKGCPEDPVFQKPDRDIMVCCTEWAKAVKSGKPCDPSHSPNCTGRPPGPDNPPFSDTPYMENNKPDYIWVSAASGNAKITDCYSPPYNKVVATENNGTMLKVENRVRHSLAGLIYLVKGERAGGTYEGCIHAEDVACDPANVRK